MTTSITRRPVCPFRSIAWQLLDGTFGSLKPTTTPKVLNVSRLTRFLSSTIGQKYLMGITGLLLCGFLVTHLAGNLNVFLGPTVFNGYADKLHALGPLLVVLEIGLFAVLLLHIVVSILLTISNRSARGERGYELKESKQDVSVLNAAPRTWMFISGGIVLVFLIYHVAGMKFGLMDGAELLSDPGIFRSSEAVEESEEALDKIGEIPPYRRVVGILRSPISAAVYVIGVVVLGFHLSHGFASAFRSLGIVHPRYTPLIYRLGLFFAVVITVGFASIPLYIWAFRVGVPAAGG